MYAAAAHKSPRSIHGLARHLLLFVLLMLAAMHATAGSLALAWDPVNDPRVAGYKVHYGTSAGNYAAQRDVGNVTTSTIPNLVDGATYYFAVTAYDGSLVQSGFSNEVVGTVPAAPVGAPVANFTASTTTGTAPLAMNFTSTSTGSITTYAWTFGDGTSSTAQNPAKTYSTAGTYTVALTVTGSGGSNTKSVANYITVTAAVPDTTPPSVPSGLTGTAASSTSVSLSWSASTDNFGVTGYRVFRCEGTTCTNFAQVGAPTGTTFTNTALNAATTYRFAVKAIDAAGNLSAYSTIVNVLTPVATAGDVTSNLVGHWMLNEGSGTTARDSAGNRPGTLGNGPTWVPGKLGQAVSFDGVDDFIDLGVLDISGSALTIAAWIKADSFATDDGRILSKSMGTTEQDHYFMLSTIDSGGSKLRFRLKTGTTTSTLVASSGVLTTGQWIHVAAVYDGSAMILYQDGVEVGRLAKTGAVAINATTKVAIGRNPQAYGTFDGAIDDVRVYQRALSNSDVQALIGLASPAPSPTPSDTTPPTVPSSLTATASGSTAINLSWTASTDNVGVTGYRVERCTSAGCTNFAQIATPTGTTFSNSGLAGSTSYSYRVRAIDAAGNLSAYSAIATATTAAPPVAAPTANFTATPVSGTAPITVNFTSTSSGTIDTYAWDFGDGTSSTAANPSKVYSTPGTYTVVLTVTGPGGSNTTTRANFINVSSAPTVSAGMLSGSLTSASSGTIDLTSLGSSDWVQWPTGARKATGNGRISNYTLVGASSAGTYGSDRRAMRWTDGSPIASGSSNEGASVGGGTGKGFRVVVPADTTTRTLVIYVGTANSTGKLTATLSDRSAPDYVNAGITRITKSWDGYYTLTYRAASAGQSLTVQWTVDKAKYQSNWATVRLQGAALK